VVAVTGFFAVSAGFNKLYRQCFYKGIQSSQIFYIDSSGNYIFIQIIQISWEISVYPEKPEYLLPFIDMPDIFS